MFDVLNDANKFVIKPEYSVLRTFAIAEVLSEEKRHSWNIGPWL